MKDISIHHNLAHKNNIIATNGGGNNSGIMQGIRRLRLCVTAHSHPPALTHHSTEA